MLLIHQSPSYFMCNCYKMSSSQPRLHIICMSTNGSKSGSWHDVEFFFLHVWLICAWRLGRKLKLHILRVILTIYFHYTFEWITAIWIEWRILLNSFNLVDLKLKVQPEIGGNHKECMKSVVRVDRMFTPIRPWHVTWHINAPAEWQQIQVTKGSRCGASWTGKIISCAASWPDKYTIAANICYHCAAGLRGSGGPSSQQPEESIILHLVGGSS